MKHFVYLDTDLIYSYLAQVKGGLPSSFQSERDEELKNEKSLEEYPKKSGGEIGVGIPGIFNFTHNLDRGNSVEINTITQTSAGREIISKAIHDNSHDMLIEHIKGENNFIDETNTQTPEIGDYIKLHGNLKMVDLSIFSQFSSDTFGKVYNSILSREINETLEKLNRNQKRNPELKKEFKKQKDKISGEIGDMDYIASIIDYMKNTLPSDKFVVFNDIFVPLNKKYLREDYNSLRYKYSSNSYIIGNITGKVEGILDLKSNNEFDALFKARDEMTLVFPRPTVNKERL